MPSFALNARRARVLRGIFDEIGYPSDIVRARLESIVKERNPHRVSGDAAKLHQMYASLLRRLTREEDDAHVRMERVLRVRRQVRTAFDRSPSRSRSRSPNRH